MSGGKGGSTSSSVSIPSWLEDPSKRAIGRGEDMAEIGYMPWLGPDVAAFNPTQEAAFANTNQAAGAFGMNQSTGTGMPAPTDYNGVSGYSGYPIFDQGVEAWKENDPQQAAAYEALFQPGGGSGAPAPYNPGGGSNPGSPGGQIYADMLFGDESAKAGAWNAVNGGKGGSV